MLRKAHVSVLAILFALVLAPAAFAQGRIMGKVVDGKGQPIEAATVTIEFEGGVTRKFEIKTNRRGEFAQIGLPSGSYKITASHEKHGIEAVSARVNQSRPTELTLTLVPGAGGTPAEAAKAVELRKLFDEGVAAARANNHDLAIEKFTAGAALIPNCHECYYNIGFAYLQKKDEKQAEASWLKATELKSDYGDALNALATLYNNQKRFTEAAAISAKAAAAGGSGSADAVFNQGIILWNQGKIPEAKAKFEEALKVNPDHPESNFQFGMALLNEGKIPDAVASFETYLKLAPDGQYAAQAKSMLAQLKP